MESTNAAKSLQPIPTHYQIAAEKQSVVAGNKVGMFDLDYVLMRKIVQDILKDDPGSKIGETCKAAEIVYKDLTSLEAALEHRDLTIIMRIIAVISATDPNNFEKRALNIVNKISARAVKGQEQDLIFLKKILKLPTIYGYVDFACYGEVKLLLEWAFERDLGALVEVILINQLIHDVDIFIELGKRCCNEGKANVFQALLQNQAISKMLLCRSSNLRRAVKGNYIEIVKLIQPHFAEAHTYGEGARAIIIYGKGARANIMDTAVKFSRLEVAKFLDEHSIGKLIPTIERNLDGYRTGSGFFTESSIEMFEFALQSFRKDGKPLVRNGHLEGILFRALSHQNMEISRFAWKKLIERDARISHKYIVGAATAYDDPTIAVKDRNLVFAYSVLEDCEAKFGKTNTWIKMAAVLLMKEIKYGNVKAVKHLLNDVIVNPSMGNNAIAFAFIEAIKNNDVNKEEWKDLFTQLLFSMNFNPFPHFNRSIHLTKRAATNLEVEEIIDFYIKSSQLEIRVAQLANVIKGYKKEIKRIAAK